MGTLTLMGRSVDSSLAIRAIDQSHEALISALVAELRQSKSIPFRGQIMQDLRQAKEEQRDWLIKRGAILQELPAHKPPTI
jgi:hypothetical protein